MRVDLHTFDSEGMLVYVLGENAKIIVASAVLQPQGEGAIPVLRVSRTAAIPLEFWGCRLVYEDTNVTWFVGATRSVPQMTWTEGTSTYIWNPGVTVPLPSMILEAGTIIQVAWFDVTCTLSKAYLYLEVSRS